MLNHNLKRVYCWSRERSRSKLIFSWFVLMKNTILVSECSENMQLVKNGFQFYFGDYGVVVPSLARSPVSSCFYIKTQPTQNTCAEDATNSLSLSLSFMGADDPLHAMTPSAELRRDLRSMHGDTVLLPGRISGSKQASPAALWWIKFHIQVNPQFLQQRPWTFKPRGSGFESWWFFSARQYQVGHTC